MRPMARAAEGEVGDPLTPRMLLKVAKKTASCGTAFEEQTFGMIKQKEDRMIRAIGWLDHYWIGGWL